MDEKLQESLATGRELYHKKEYARAEPYLAQLASARVPYADVYNMLGVIRHDAGEFEGALACFQEALRINPAYTEASLNLAVTYNDMGRYLEARDLYLGALDHSTKPGAKLDAFVMGKVANMYAEIGDVYASCGAHEEAISEYQRALALRPKFIDIRLRLAQVQRDAGFAAEAKAELETILSQNPDYVPARIHLALTLFSLGSAQKSIAAFEAVLTKDPENRRAQLYLDMVRAHHAKNETPTAET